MGDKANTNTRKKERALLKAIKQEVTNLCESLYRDGNPKRSG